MDYATLPHAQTFLFRYYRCALAIRNFDNKGLMICYDRIIIACFTIFHHVLLQNYTIWPENWAKDT